MRLVCHENHILKVGILLLIPVGLSSCSGAESGELQHVDVLRELGYSEEVRIGSVEDPVRGFSQIRQVRIAANGELFVLESQAREVRVFSPQGEPLRVLGGAGQGPGEFSRPMSLGLLGDTLWVTDLTNRRITWFGPDGAVLTTTAATGVNHDTGDPAISVTIVPSRPRADGLIESDRGMISYIVNGPLAPYQYPVLLFQRDGSVVDTIRWEHSESFAGYFEVGGRGGLAPSLRPEPPVRAAAPDGGGIVVDWEVSEDGHQGLLDVLRTDELGDTLYTRRLEFNPIPVPEHVVDSLIEPLRRAAPTYGVSESEMLEAARMATTVPEYRAPIRTVQGGSDGTLWIQLNSPELEGNDWVVIDQEGEPVGRIRLPPKMIIGDSALPVVWGIELDELDVPWIARLSLQ